MLLDAYPAAAAMADSRGDLPLHLALGSSCKHLEAKLRFLAQRHPQAIAVKGGKGLKPVALARQFQCSADIVRMLCRLSPQDHRELDAPRSISEACAKAVDGFQSRQKGADERIGLLDRCLRAILSVSSPSILCTSPP